jgi:hypothetical protein
MLTSHYWVEQRARRVARRKKIAVVIDKYITTEIS